MRFPFIIKSRRKEEADRYNFDIVYTDLHRYQAEVARLNNIIDGVRAGMIEVERQAYVKGVKDGSNHIKQQVMQHARSSVK